MYLVTEDGKAALPKFSVPWELYSGPLAATCKRTNPPTKPANRPRRKAVRKNPAELVIRNPSDLKQIKTADLRALARSNPEFRRALKAYEDFHGEPPTALEEVEVDGVSGMESPFVWTVGETLASEYRTQKNSGRSPGPPYRHKYRRGGQLTVATAKGAGPFIAKRRGSKLRVTDRGIED